MYRPSLTKYHTHLLTLIGDGTGRWTFTPIASSPSGPAVYAPADAGSSNIAVSAPDTSKSPTAPSGPAAGDLIRVLEEIRTLERQLEEAKVWEARVRELEEVLQVREEPK